MPQRHHRPARAFAVLVALSLGACDNGASGNTTTAPSTMAPTTTERPDDGVFLLGLVAPGVGGGAEIGTSVEGAVALAVDEVNAAGGINGQRVQIVRREEGDNASAAELAVQSLVQLGADAIIGPTSSVNVLGTLGHAVDGGVLTCSPTATALALDDYPDSGLFVRTAPSDSLQAKAIAQAVDESGNDRVAVIYLDDAYGRPFAEAVSTALQETGTSITTMIGFTTAERTLDDAAAVVAATTPEVVVVIADATNGPAAVTAVNDAASVPRPLFVVNDALRRPAATAQPFGGTLANRVEGVSPLAFTANATFLAALTDADPAATGLYAHNAYDCVNLVALAAVAAGTTRGPAVAAALPNVSSGGTACDSFADCVGALQDDRNIDYDGPSGALAIGPDGDPTIAVFELFTFDEAGRDVGAGTFVVTGS